MPRSWRHTRRMPTAFDSGSHVMISAISSGGRSRRLSLNEGERVAEELEAAGAAGFVPGCDVDVIFRMRSRFAIELSAP